MFEFERTAAVLALYRIDCLGLDQQAEVAALCPWASE
jgi:hypothetical protein